METFQSRFSLVSQEGHNYTYKFLKSKNGSIAVFQYAFKDFGIFSMFSN